MNTYDTVLYLHLLALLAGFAASSIGTLCLVRVRAAQTLAEAAPWGMVAGKAAKVFPFALFGFLATGAYMTVDRWTWDAGWIAVSLAALAVLVAQGPVVGRRRAKLLQTALKQNGPGALGEAARQRASDRMLWVATLANPAIVLGVAWVMTQKPSTAGSILAIVIAYAVGAIAALRVASSAVSR